jgi:hypothetical protein
MPFNLSTNVSNWVFDLPATAQLRFVERLFNNELGGKLIEAVYP